MTNVFRLFLATFLVFLFSYAPSDANAKNHTLVVPVNRAELVEVPGTFTNVTISDKRVLRVIKHSPSRISIIGKKMGAATVSLSKKGKTVWSSSVRVGSDIPDIKRALNEFFPNEAVEVKWANNSVVLSGAVSGAEVASRIVNIVEEYLPTNSSNLINLMQVKGGQQVMLRVQIGEVQRGAIDKLGFSANGLMSQTRMFDVASEFDAMVGDGVMKILAEPNLTAISGESAEFLAGGEFPVPVAQGDNVMSVQYKPFGVSLKFTPTVLSQNRIRLNVEPEVSDISTKGAIKVNGMTVPAITSRRAKTTVELAPGESFMIAGLIKDDLRNVVGEMPPFGDIPILGALFRSTAFQRNETELVIAVTPYIAKPVVASEIKLPTDDFRPASVLESYFMGALGSIREVEKSEVEGLEGSYGYIVE
jgi:pilus assembly protein CpaC